MQKAQQEQNDQQHQQVIQLLNEKTDIIESAITRLANEIQEFREERLAVLEILREHEVAIRTLKKKVS